MVIERLTDWAFDNPGWAIGALFTFVVGADAAAAAIALWLEFPVTVAIILANTAITFLALAAQIVGLIWISLS